MIEQTPEIVNLELYIIMFVVISVWLLGVYLFRRDKKRKEIE
jgi:hypothetical protein